MWHTHLQYCFMKFQGASRWPFQGAAGKRSSLASKKDIALLQRYVEKLADSGNFDRHKKPSARCLDKKDGCKEPSKLKGRDAFDFAT